MFERYTESARKAVFMARFEASRSASPYIETEHLLLGILLMDSSLAMRLLEAPEKIEAIRQEVEKHHPLQESPRTVMDIPLSQDARRALTRANQESEKVGHKHIGVEHLLLGMARDKTTLAAQLLREHGVTPEVLEAEVGRSAPEPASPVREAVKEAVGRAAHHAEPPPPPVVRNLSEEARSGRLRPVIGREHELDRVVQVLSRKIRNNPVLVGEPGVGKTAIMEGVVQRIVDCRVPAALADRPAFAIDASSLIAPSRRSRSGEGGDRLIAQLTNEPIGILCVDGLLDVAASPGWGAIEATHVLEVLSRSGIQCLATGTPGGLRKAIDNAGVLVRHFEVVLIAPPTEDDAIAVLNGLKPDYERFHNVVYDKGVVEAAVFASGRFLPHRNLPDRALDLLDEAGARAQVKGVNRVTRADLESAIAERAGVSFPAVLQILALKKGKEPQAAAEKLAAAVPPDQHEWLPFLAAYLAGSSKEEVERLIQGMRDFKQE